MHERTAPSGHRYLIVLIGEGPATTFDYAGQLCVGSYSFVPGNWSSEPARSGNNGPFWSASMWQSNLKPERLRIYAGQADPEDASHFTVRYEFEGKMEIMDGFVDDIEWGKEGDPWDPLTRAVRVKLTHRRAS